ncbi:MAG: peptidoglycan/LPS O-acetylase OafA/YrhL [Planctomycetota bacterium]|jgi:peptidoglycan/LPS O-acetylase OafA/YrhL
MVVVFSHASSIGLHLHPSFDWRGTGRLGVFLFFVLSSFLLTRIALAAPAGELRRPKYWGEYVQRRLLRVLPVYLVILVLYFLLEGWDARRTFDHVLMIRSERHLWTIPVELRWYGVLPLVVLLLALCRRWLWLGAIGLMLLAGAVRLYSVPDYAAKAPDFAPALMPFMPIFLMGSVAAVLHKLWVGSKLDRSPWSKSLWEAAGWLAFAGLVLHFPSIRQAISGEAIEHTRYHLLFDRFGILCSVLLLGTLLGQGFLRRIFELRVLRGIGAISYSLYLVHRMILDRVVDNAAAWSDPLPMLFFLFASISLAWLLWRAVERPGMGLGKTRAGRTGA